MTAEALYPVRGLCRCGCGEPTDGGRDAHAQRAPFAFRIEDRGYVTPCWLWVGRYDRKGYGSVTRFKRHTGAHRLAYENLVGAIPEGLTIDHLCFVKGCVNPEHLEAVTFEENHRRWAESITHCKHGHEMTPENTRVGVQKGKYLRRTCRACHRASEARRRTARPKVTR
jgi:hypothetical protein